MSLNATLSNCGKPLKPNNTKLSLKKDKSEENKKLLYLSKDVLCKNKIIELKEKHKVLIEIYKITCTVSKKSYIGQAVSHILNHKKYRKYGHIGRFKSHVSEAFSSKKKQCRALNNAIRKYGKDKFDVVILHACTKENGNIVEELMIKKYNTLCPNGYNILTGGKCFRATIDNKKRVSSGVQKYYTEKRYDRFKNIKIPKDIDIQSIIKPLRRHGEQYGWYLYYNRIKTDFGGVHIELETSKKNLIKFIKHLQDK